LSDLLFDDLRVLDVGSWIAAPVATTMLADFGADVLKIEAPGMGDGYRAFAASVGAPDSDTNFTWQMDARNKRSMILNLKSEAGREVLNKLVMQSDVYVTNHSPALRSAWGLDYETLSAANPRLIYASLTAYGEQGEERNREAFDLVAYWSRSGLMDLVRAPESNPAAALPGMGDHPTAVTMYAGILTALLRRQKTGEGSFVHTSLLANGLWSASCIAQGAFADAQFQRYRHNLADMVTRVLYQTADNRWLQLTMVRTEEELDALFAILGAPDLLLDSRFCDAANRLAHGRDLVELIRPLFLERTSDEWLREFEAANVPVALVGEVERLPQDPQVLANNMVQPAEALGMPYVIRHPINVQGLPSAELSPAPDHGEHGAEVLGELGYAAEDIERLRDEGVI